MSDEEDNQEASATFQLSSECDLEVHCSPFGISGIYIKVNNSENVGVGSAMSRLTGSTTGKILYNDPQDLQDSKYKLYGVVEDGNILRIDFVKIFNEPKDEERSVSPNHDDIPSIGESPNDEEYEAPDIVFRGDVPAGRPDVVDPFIGIFNFEKIPSS